MSHLIWSFETVCLFDPQVVRYRRCFDIYSEVVFDFRINIIGSISTDTCKWKQRHKIDDSDIADYIPEGSSHINCGISLKSSSGSTCDIM